MSRKARVSAAKEREQRVVAAKTAVETKELSLRVAAERFDVPKSTIHDHVSGKHTKAGAGRPRCPFAIVHVSLACLNA